MFETGSSSAHGSFSPPRPAHDITFMRLARALAVQEALGLPPHGKGISIKEDNSGGVDPSNSGIKGEIGLLKKTIFEKDVLIRKLDIRVPDLEVEKQSKSKQITKTKN